jgi:hypothetical protein
MCTSSALLPQTKLESSPGILPLQDYLDARQARYLLGLQSLQQSVNKLRAMRLALER